METAGGVTVTPASPLKTIQADRAGWEIFLVNIFCSDKPPQASCSVESCDDRQYRRDQANYVLQELRVDGQCCPDFRKVACRHGGNIYQVSNVTSSVENFNIKIFPSIKDWRLLARPGPLQGLQLQPERWRG